MKTVARICVALSWVLVHCVAISILSASTALAHEVYWEQLVKTSEDHIITAPDPRYRPIGWQCEVRDFAPLVPGPTVSPLVPERERTANPIAYHSCWEWDDVSESYGQGISLNFNSIYDVGDWTISCGDNLAASAIHNSCLLTQPLATCGVEIDTECAYPLVFPDEPITIYVHVTNDPPTAAVTYSPTPAWNQTLTFNASAHDPDDPDGGSGRLVYRWSVDQRPDTSTAALLDAETDHPRLPLSSDADIGEWRIRLDLDDNEGERRTFYSSYFTVPNMPPDISIVGAPAMEIYVTESIELEVTSFEDPDGGDLEITWGLLEAPPATGRVPGVIHTGSGAAGAALPPIETTSTDIGTWRFSVTARDNELIDRGMGDPVSAEVRVEVLNGPPEVDISGEELIDIGETILVEAIGSDPDGGLLHFRWDIIQAPQSADIFVEEGYSQEADAETSRLEIPTVSTDCYEDTPVRCSAGTWIVRVVATDDEGDANEDEVTLAIVVDAPPEARIDGPDPPIIGLLSFPLELEGGDSLDPDSRCGPPDYCHDTLDGRPVSGISTGIEPPIGGYAWSLVDVPFELWEDYLLGRVDEVFDIPAYRSTMTLAFGDIEQGDWTFQLDVRDGEGNEDSTTFTISVVNENGAPIAIVSPPMRYATNDVGNLEEAIILDGSLSFDLDNFLIGEDPREGISSYLWSVLEGPPGCLFSPLPSGPAASIIALYEMGQYVPSECLGYWRIGLTVSDDDEPPLLGFGATTVIIGNCPETLCIDHPTSEHPERVEFVRDTDIRIEYHLDSALYDDPDDSAYAFGAFSILEIFHESDPATPVFTSVDPNVLASDRGGKLVFHWNGYGDAEGRPRPAPGYYDVKVSLFDYLFRRHEIAVEAEAIWLAVAEPRLLTSSDRYVSIDALRTREDTLTLNYEIVGSATPDELRWRILNESGTSVFGPTDPERRLLRPDRTGTISWDGRVNRPDDGTLLEAGIYTVELEAFRSGASLGVSDPFTFVAFRLDMDVDADRSGTVDDDADEAHEQEATIARGAIYTVNYDRDGVRTDGSGTPIPDAIHFADNGDPIEEDFVIDNTADTLDMAPVVVRGLGVELPPELQVYLRFPEPTDSGKIHLFKQIMAGERAILGSATAVGSTTEIDITRWLNSASPDFIGDAEGAMTFGVEGLFFKNDGAINTYRGYFELVLEVRLSGSILFSDMIRMKVAPWIMLPDTQPSMEVWAMDAGVYNETFRYDSAADPGYYGMDHSGQLCALGPCPTASDTLTPWLQDQIEIGYYQRPGGPPTHCVFRLPHFRDITLPQPGWPLTNLLQPDVGVFQLGINLGGGDGDFGGNLQLTPPTVDNPLGKIVAGRDMSNGLLTFLSSQEVQMPVVIPVEWLNVGHIDEIFGFTNDSNRVVIASPILAFNRLEDIDPANRGKSVFFAEGIEPIDGSVSADSADAKRIETGIDHTSDSWNFIRIFEDGGSGAAGQVAHISHRGNGYLEVDEVWNTTSKVVPGSGAAHFIMEYLSMDTAAPSHSGWFIRPQTGDRYVLVEDTKHWRNGTPALITVAEVLADNDLFELNTVDIAWTIDDIRATLSREIGPGPTFVEVPVIYIGNRMGFDTGGSALAFTPGLANFQVVNHQLYFPRQFGPLDIATGQDIFEGETRRLLPDAVFLDDWDYYHVYSGEVHCGTSVRRQILTHDWWDTP